MIAKFNDGKSSITILSQIEFDDNGLIVKDENSENLAYILYEDLVVIAEIIGSLPGVIGSKTSRDMRLEIGDPVLFGQVASRAVRRKKLSPVSFSWKTIGFLFSIAVLMLVLIFRFQDFSVHLIASSIPKSWDDKLGKYVAEQLTAQSPICTHPQGQKALDKLVNKLISASGENIAVTVKVIDNDEEMNAFAIPGNQIFVYTGLIHKVKNYEELAGVLAHEIGHLLKHHPTEGLIRSLSFNFIGKLISGGSSQLEYVLATSNLFLILHYSRAQETEADMIAIRILTNAGIGPKALSAFFVHLQEEEKKLHGNNKTVKSLEKFLSTHPLTEDRINYINAQSFSQPLGHDPILSKEDWAEIQCFCRKQG